MSTPSGAFWEEIMKWIALCLALAGLWSTAQASTPPAMSPIPESSYASLPGELVQLAQVQCLPPKVLNAAGACVCPAGVNCNTTPPCPPPKVVDPKTGACVCPPGTFLTANGACIRCPPPKVFDPKTGACVCPPGTFPTASGQCVRCPPPKVFDSKTGACVCPPGTFQSAASNQCLSCPPPKIIQNGQCVCPPGTRPNPLNGQCVKP